MSSSDQSPVSGLVRGFIRNIRSGQSLNKSAVETPSVVSKAAHKVDSLSPEEFLPLLQATLCPDEPEWHKFVDKAEVARGGDYPDEESVEHAYSYASGCLDKATALIHCVHSEPDLAIIRTCLIAHASAASQEGARPAALGCIYCTKKN